MAEEQIRTNVTIGVGVEGGDSAAQRLNKLALQLGALEKTAGAMRGLANLPIQFKELIASSYNSAKGLEATKDQAKALKPAIQAIGTAVKGLGLPDAVLKSAGLDDKSLRAAGRNAGAFQTLIENLSKTRIRAIDQAAASTGKAEQLSAELGIARSAAIREEVAAAKDLKAALRETKLPVAPAVPAIRAQALLGQGPLVSRARRPTAATAYAGATDRATTSLAREASAASTAAAAMRELAGAKKTVATGEQNVAKATGNVIQSLMREIKTAPQAAAALHKMLRQNEAQFNKGYAQRSSATFGVLGAAVQKTTRAINLNNDALIGQIKQVAVLATTFTVLQAVAGRIQEGFSHLTGGIISFNQMLERTTVGFRVLFANQEKQVQALREMGDESKQIDYITMGYNNAQSAAEGMVETIRQFANVTPFRFEELAETTLRMKAFGFGMDEILVKSEDAAGGFDGAVVAIGDAVAALGGGAERFRRITYALGQMKQAGRVYQNDMMQLANAGIGGYQYIANSLRKEITEGNTGRKEDVKAGFGDLYDQLSKNTIETVRRLTTNGQISGEAAARAIIDGLKTDFGGGMNEFSKTFVGAWTTLADTSQSLVATAFSPFYNALRDSLVDLSQFFQTPEADELAKSFQPTIVKLTNQIFSFVRTSGDIFQLFVKDITGALEDVKGKVNTFGIDFGAVFNSLRDGIGVVVSLLKNDVTRGLIGTSTLLATFAGFVKSNPLLSIIAAAVAGLGLLKQAYDENTAGFRNTIDGLSGDFLSLISVIQENLIPIVVEFSAALGSVVFVAALELFRGLAKVLEVVAGLLAGILKTVSGLAPILGVIIGGLTVKLGFSLALVGLGRLIDRINAATLRIKNMGDEAVAASSKINTVFGGPGKSSGKKGQTSGFFANRGSNIGMGLFGAGIAADMLGAPEIGGLLTNISMIGFAISGLKAAFAGTAIATQIGAVAAALTLPGIAAIGLFAAGIAAVAAAISTGLTDQGLDTPQVAEAKIYDEGFRQMRDQLGIGREEREAAAAKKAEEDARKAFEANYNAQRKRVGEIRKEIARLKEDQSAMSDRAQEETKERIRLLDLERIKIDALSNSAAGAFRNSQAFVDFRAGEREGLDVGSYQDVLNSLKERKEAAEEAAAAEYKLLVGEKQRTAESAKRNKLQEKYNRLLGQAQQKLQATQSALQDLATKTLQSLLDTNIARINPFTGLVDEALELEDVLRIQQEMLFTNFETITGTTKSFEEYADILDAIAPLQEKDRTEGKINLAAVTQRLKIEKERRRELELIRKNAEIEYDLGLATLQQYDQSVDPLQRAVNLRKAQAQYETDIRDSQMSGLELALDQATGSNQWAVAEKQVEAKLRDIEAGQSLILGEMERRFEVYNERVAAIMANPNYSETDRAAEFKKATDSLIADLETNFGVTKEKMDEQFALLNVQIGAARDATDLAFAGFTNALQNPTLPVITWGQSIGTSLDGAFNSIYNNMLGHFNEISKLAEKIKDVAAGGGGTPKPPPEQPKRFSVEGQKTLIEQVRARLMAGTTIYGRDKFLAIKKVVDPKINKLSSLVGNNAGFEDQLEKVRESLRNYGLRRGGMAMGGNPYLVGEGGPELFLPRSSGLVLNNSVSSRLMSMLTGRPDQAGSNVTINVNNPVIRNENDIRKLALEISRVQASQFRTEGGRL